MTLRAIIPPPEVKAIFDESSSTSNPQVNRILMVGALLDRYKDNSLSGPTEDEDFLSLSAQKAIDIGFSFNKNTQINVCNLEYGSNFFNLDENQAKADIVILCNLLFAGGENTNTPLGLSRIATQEDKAAFVPNNWKTALKKSESKLLVNVGYHGKLYKSLPAISEEISNTELFERTGEPITFLPTKKRAFSNSPYKADFFVPR